MDPPAVGSTSGADAAADRSAAASVAGRIAVVAGVPVLLSASTSDEASVWDRLMPAGAAVAAPAVLELALGGAPVTLPKREPDEVYGPVRVWRGDVLAVAHDEGMSIVAEESGARIAWHGDRPDRALRQSLPLVLGHLLAGCGVAVLHAGAVVRGADAVLVLGDTGAGKSTLVAAAADAGWSVLGDDMAGVRQGDDVPHVHGVARAVAVPEEMAAAALPPLDADPRRRRVLDLETAEGWFPLVAVVAVGHASTPEGRLEVMDERARTDLVPRSFTGAGDVRLLRAFLPVLAAVSRLPAYRLLLGADATSRAAVAATLLDSVVPRR